MSKLKDFGHKAVVLFEDIGLIVITISTVIAMGFEITSMVSNMKVTLSDILLLFIYLEVFTMASMYFKSGKLPVRIPLYIAMIAIARYIILDMKNLDTLRILGLSGAVFILALAIILIRYGHNKFSPKDSDKT